MYSPSFQNSGTSLNSLNVNPRDLLIRKIVD
jgi:hypothetical protein